MTAQEIFKNVWSAGDITVGNITQIYKTILNLENIPKPKGFPQNIISSSTDKFVGRERDLKSIGEQLQRHNEVVIAAVEGMGGVGKTELAIQYSLLHLQLKTYPGGICWLRSREQDIGLQIVNFARTDLDLNPPEDLELPDRVRWCWKRWREGNTLIVLDDVKNYSDIKPYLPPQPSQFKVLITTRLKLDLPSSLYLEVLSETDALELLRQLIGSKKVNQELEKATELCQRLGYLPLALQLVGRYVKQYEISITEELRRLEEKGLGHPSMSVPENDPTWTLEIKRGVEAAFELSWEELSESAQQLGCLLSLFALAPIPWSLVESSALQPSKKITFPGLKLFQVLGLFKRRSPIKQEPETLEDARVELENFHLLQSDNTYQLHQLIHEFLRNKQNNLATADKQKYNFCTAIVEVAQKISQIPTLSEINSLISFIPHLAVAAKELSQWIADDDLTWVYVGLGRFYKGQVLYQESESWCEQCLAIVKERLGEDHPSVATSLNNLAEIYRLQGRYDEAEHLYLQTLELSKRLLGENHPYVALSLHNLAELYHSQGRYDEAEHLYLQTLELKKRLLGEDHPDVTLSLHNLAGIYYSQGRYDEAEHLFLQTLELSKRLWGENHPYIASSLNGLAEIYHSQGRYDEAEHLFLQTLELSKRLWGENHPYVASSLNNLAGLYDSQGRYDEAELLLLQVLELSKRLLGEDHPDVASSFNNLAGLYYSQGRYDEAEPLYLQTLELSKRLLGEEHPYVASSFNNLALLYKSQGRYDEAEPLYLQTLELRKRLLGEDHPYVATSFNNLAELYRSQGRYDEAEPLYLQALKIAEKALGKNHPNTNILRANYEQFKKR